MKARKLLITGVGRCGTTFLVETLTHLGMDTGFTAGQVRLHRTWKKYERRAHAGLERNIDAPHLVCKSPTFCDRIDEIVESGLYEIVGVIVCVRDLDECTLSRIAVGKLRGGLWKTSNPRLQRRILAETMHRLIVGLARHELPHRLLEFPRCVQDADYCYRVVAPFLDCTREQFLSAHAEAAIPEWCHSYAGTKIDRLHRNHRP